MIREVEVAVDIATLGPEGLPAMNVELPPDLSAADRILLGEQNGRLIADRPASSLPYRHQNHYGRDVSPHVLRGVELSNQHLRAVFLPSLGGRLWSLEEVVSGRQLLFQPDAIQFGNLALRDAWFSGGIEWNLGMSGHWGLTSSPVGAGIVEVDGHQVLRMWAWERLTRMVWRMDAWLPEDSTFLFTSPRITNEHAEDKAFYWWSNAAAPQHEQSRVLAPARTALFNNYDGILERVSYPDGPDNTDRSLPARAPQAVDYFFDTALQDGSPHPTPWVAGCDADGRGLVLTSTPGLRGKKLFVWGNTRGGGTWQKWLNGSGQYYELQSGWARTQKEHMSLPGGTTATWVEAQGAITIDSALPYDEAVQRGEEQLPAAGILEAEAVFARAAPLAPSVLQQSDGWGRVEVEAGFLPDDVATPFRGAELDAEQEAWLAAARSGGDSSALDRSPQTGADWESVVQSWDEGAGRSLHLGYMAWAKGDRTAAAQHWLSALKHAPRHPMVLHALTLCTEDGWDAFDYAERAHEAQPDDDDLLVEYLTRASSVPTVVLQVVDRLSPARRELPRVRLAAARALVAQGHLAEAADIIDTLVLPGLREVSSELADLWSAYTEAAGSDAPLPAHLDFSMS